MTDQLSLITALRNAAATVVIKDSLQQPFLTAQGTQLVVNDQDLQVFEYPDESAVNTDAAALSDTLSGKGTAMVSWVGSPHAYRSGRVIALYVGDDAGMLKLLQEIMGAPFAQQQGPAALPAATQLATTPGTGSPQTIDQAALIEALQAQGLDVRPAGKVVQPFFSIEGVSLQTDGADVQVFEFGDAASAKAAMEKISGEGNSINLRIDWVAPPHFFQAGKVIALYVGDSAKIINALTTALGPQAAGL